MEFSKVGPDGVETLPAEYLSGQSKIKVEVKADKSDGYDITL